MSHCYKTSQMTRVIAAVPKNSAIDPMYSGSSQKCRNIVAVFALAAILQISCSDFRIAL